MLSFAEYMDDLKYKIAYYGFTYCPLTVGDIFQCHVQGLDLDQAYDVACDANALEECFNIQESINAIKGL